MKIESMSCDKCLERLSAFADGELRDAEAAKVRAHLETCPGCRAELTEIRSLCKLLKSLPEPVPSSEFWRDVRFAIRGASISKRNARSRVPATAAGWALATGLMLAAWIISGPTVTTPVVKDPPTTIHSYALVSLHAATRAESPLADRGTLLGAIIDSHAADWADDHAFDVD